MVEKHELCCCEVGLTFNSELIAPMGNLGTFDEKRAFVAREVKRGHNGTYEVVTPAT